MSSPSSGKVRIALVGLGKMGLSHLAILNALDKFEVVAICDKAKLIGNGLAQYCNFPFFDDFDDLMGSVELDAVLIASPTVFHADMINKALDKGLHVFCEKPLTLSGAASRDIAEKASGTKLITQAGYHNRFVGTFAEVRKLLELGAIGKCHHINAEAYGPVVTRAPKDSWRNKADAGGGCLLDYAAHPANLMNWYMGPATSCFGASLGHIYSKQVEDAVYATLGFSNQATGQLTVDWSDESSRKMTTKVTLFGNGGKIYADRQELRVFIGKTGKPPAGYSYGWNIRYITDLTPNADFYLRGEEYSLQLMHFAAAILEGLPETKNSFSDACLTDETMSLIRLANETQPDLDQAAAPRKGLMRRLVGG